MKRAFTLLELLVVVGIMGLLGTAATGSYTALVRGMNERSAVAAASGVLRAARERANVDRVVTAVYCYNRLIKSPTTEESGVAVGIMTAVRRAGRISYVSGNFLYDEFADLDHAYEVEDNEGNLKRGGGSRLFRFPGTTSDDMRYSIVSDRVFSDDQTQVTLFSGLNGRPSTNILLSAFYDMKTSARQPQWKAGDAYALEFNEVQLPDGMIFGSKVPSDATRDEYVKTIVFDPDSPNENDTIEVRSTKADASGYPKDFKKAGTASSDSNKAV